MLSKMKSSKITRAMGFVLALLSAWLALPVPTAYGQAAMDRERKVTLITDYDLDSTTYTFCNTTCGTLAASGWLYTWGVDQTSFFFHLDQMVVTGGIDMKIECREDAASTVTTVYTSPNYTSTGTIRVIIPENYYQCRMGFKIGTSDDGGDLTTNLEKISVNALLVNFK